MLPGRPGRVSEEIGCCCAFGRRCSRDSSAKELDKRIGYCCCCWFVCADLLGFLDDSEEQLNGIVAVVVATIGVLCEKMSSKRLIWTFCLCVWGRTDEME